MDEPVEGLRILMLEDVPSDMELEESELRDGGLVFTLLRVDTRAAFVQALDEFQPNIILADYKLPAYSGRDALEYARRTHPQIPVIMVTGAMGDEAAVELLKLGARDYVLKDSLARLVPAIKRALSEERGIRNRKLAEGKYKALFSEAMDGIALVDCATWRIEDCNSEFERQAGRTLAQLKELKVWELYPKEQHERARHRFVAVRRSGSGRGGDFALLRPDGNTVPVEYAAKFLDIQQRSFIQIVIRDITERKRNEQVIRDEKAFSDTLIESLPAVFMLVDQRGRLLRWNRSAQQLLGLAADKLSGVNVLKFIHEEDRRYTSRNLQQALATGAAAAEARLCVRDGSRNFMFTASRIETQHGPNVMGVGFDITERKQAEAALLRANRALQTLSAGNLALVRAKSEVELLHAVTRVIVEKGGHRLAAVGYAEDDPEKSITPMAWSGMEESVYWAQQLSWADTERGQLPIGKAIRSGATQVCHDIARDPGYEPWRDAALAHGYVSSIALPLSDGGKTFGALSIYSVEAGAFDAEEVRLLEELANDLAYGIVTLRTRIAHEQHAAILRSSLEQSIQTIADTVDARDPYTAGHQRRVGELATAIAREMNLPEEQVHGIYLAAIIHDLGKIHIPAEILVKPGRLTDIEYMLIKTHPQAGYDILKGVKFPWPIADIVLQHHEKLDGSGYPQGIRGGQILLEARIVTVADIVEAMSSFRPYRPAMGIEAALVEIERGRGSVYDPEVADACLRLFAEKGFKFSSKSS